MPSRAPDAVFEEATSESQALMYRISGDYNPLHIDPEFPGVAGGGFRAPILHGLCTMGFGARAVLKCCADNEPEALRAMGVRFASPVIPGETLVTSMWREGGRVLFQTDNKETGKVCLSNGWAELQPSAKL